MVQRTAAIALALTLAFSTALLGQAQTPTTTPASPTPPQMGPAPTLPVPDAEDVVDGIQAALYRLPLAALLGTALALRPRRRGTPPRTTAVVQTQIVLAVVGALIMLVVGSSLARAFGIVGAANLIRYRSKIEDPKDAVVMLCTLAIGLASGVGLYQLAVFATGFLVGALWIIESFEPKVMKTFTLKVKAGEKTDELRRRVEAVLRRHRLRWELRTLGNDEIAYEVQLPLEMKSDAIAKEIAALDPDSNIAVELDERKKKNT